MERAEMSRGLLFSSSAYGLGSLLRRIAVKTARMLSVVLFVLAMFAVSQVASATPYLWLRADSGVWHGVGDPAINGETVATWTDYGTGDNNATNGTDATRPTFVASDAGLNGMPSLSFAGTTRYLLTNASVSQPCTILAVWKGTETGEVNYVFDGRSDTHRLAMNFSDSYFHGGLAMTGPTLVNVTASQFGEYALNEATFNTSSSSFYRNGSSTWTGTIGACDDSTGMTIGSYFAHNGYGLNGNIAEFMVFTGSNNLAERNIDLNYLGAKYNIARTGRNYYGGDSSGNGEYDFHVAGIGYESASDKVTSSPGSGSSNGLIIAENTAMNTAGQYLLAGDKNTANTWVTTNLSSGWQRWARDWYLQKTGSLDAKLTFDFGDAGVSYSSGKTYRLLYRSSSSGTFADAGMTGSFSSGDEISFTVPDGTLQTGYYTLGELLILDLTVIAFNDNGAGIGGIAGDGIQNGSEPGLSGWDFTVTGPLSGTTGPDGTLTFTSGFGNFGDSCTITEVLKDGWACTNYPLTHSTIITLGEQNIVYFGNTYTASPVPEPAALGLIGLALLAIRRRRS